MSLGRHSIANLVGVATPLLVALATIPTYISLIGPERYGVLAVIMALTGYMGFLDLGLGRAVTQRMASTNDAPAKEHSELLWTALAASFSLGALGGVVLWLGADYLLNNVIKISSSSLKEATESVIWLGVSLAFILPSSALIGALHAKLRFVEVNIIQAIGGSAGLVVPLLVASLGYIELTYLVPATLAMRALMAVLLFARCKRYIPLIGGPSIKINTIKSLLNYGGWASVMTILAPLLVTIDRLIIGTLSGARVVTTYTIPYDLVSRVMIISGSFSTALFPRLASAAQREGEMLAIKALETLLAIMTPLVLAGMFLSEHFLTLWIGNEIAAGSKGVAVVLLIGVWVNAVAIPYHARYLAKNSPKSVVIIFALELPIYLTMLWYGVTHFGVYGAALAWSSRVIIDTALILKLNNVLCDITSKALPSSMLVLTAYLTISMMVTSIAIQLIIMSGLIIISIMKDREVVIRAAKHVLRKKD